jgi:MoaA/NifB/PqqE/SkfB family radical SAM enzyme
VTSSSPSGVGVTLLPVPEVPARKPRPGGSGPVAFTAGHHFELSGETGPAALAQAVSAPLSVILQVTKRCDFDCVFCSETLHMGDPTLGQLEVIRGNLAGVRRVFLSGGEPLLRRDLPDIVDMYSGFIIGLPTNATRGLAMAPRLAGKVAFVNIGFDGPRATFSRVRGDYDKVMAGVRAFQQEGMPISLSAVVLRSTVHALPYLCQIADVLDAGKLKLILPLRKGNALGLAEREFITVEEAQDAFGRLTELRTIHDWRPAVRMTPWTPETEGHMIVIEPNGTANAWPVYDRPDLFLPLGNLLEEPVTAIWDRYPYKANHYAKYLGASIYTATRAAA